MSVALVRRTFLALSAVLAPAAALIGCAPVGRQAVRHILPCVTDTQLWVSVSLARPETSLALMIGGLCCPGRPMDSEGLHFAFSASALEPSTTYQLQLVSEERVIGDMWPLKTFPAQTDDVASLRLGAFTCAGGGDGFGFNGLQFFKPHAFRQRLFDDLLSRSPEAVIAIGDHIYWDLRGGEIPPLGRRRSVLVRWVIGAYLRARYGTFDRTSPLIGTTNERVLKRIANEQIADLYGTRFKSTPIFFISDDHDYFENDDAEKELVTFPADDFSRAAHDAVADLYYPPLPNAPSKPFERSFGVMRYGSLFEAPLLDCAGHMTISGPSPVLLPASVEQWVIDRIKSSNATHFALVPSHPFGWTAGKWREWYPDVVAPEGFTGLVTNELLGATQGELTSEAEKYLWQRGWWAQHQRLLSALASRPRSRFTFSGDIHAQGAIAIDRSGELNFSDAPLTSILVGPVSSSDGTWPSFARGLFASLPADLQASTLADTDEINGFAIFDISKERVTATLCGCGGYDSKSADDGSVKRTIELDLS